MAAPETASGGAIHSINAAAALLLSRSTASKLSDIERNLSRNYWRIATPLENTALHLVSRMRIGGKAQVAEEATKWQS
jgi:hypothetical protein